MPKKEIGQEVKLITYADFIQYTEHLLSFAQAYAQECGVYKGSGVYEGSDF